jgi:hypothetical protein
VAQDAELGPAPDEHPLDHALRALARPAGVRCLDGATGHRAELDAVSAAVRPLELLGEETHLTRAVLAFGAQRYPLLCGDLGSAAGNLIHRFRTECFQLEEPELDCGECAAVGVGGHHSQGYHDDGEWLCQWCGARPRWPVESCCTWQRNIRANGWLEQSASYRGLFEYLARTEPYLCAQRTAVWGCIYAICHQRGVCIYPEADGSRCSLIRRGEP